MTIRSKKKSRFFKKNDSNQTTVEVLENQEVADASRRRPLTLAKKEKGSLVPQKTGGQPSVLLITNSLDTGGVETHILSLAKGLWEKGCFVAVASCGGSMECELFALGIPHIYAPLDSRAPHRILFARTILKKALREYHFDILHAHSRLSAFVVSLLGKNKNTRFVTTAHLDFKMTPLTRQLAAWGEKTLAVSEDLRAYLVKEYKIAAENVTLTINGIDTDRFSPKESFQKEGEGVWESDKNILAENDQREVVQQACPKKIVHVSRIDKDRAYTAFLLCDMIGTLYERHGVTLTIVGGGELLPRLLKKAEEINKRYGNIVTLVGEAVDVLPYLREADVFVGVSRAALEAMSCGIPTILSGNSGYLGIYRLSLLQEAAATNFCCRGSRPATRELLLSDLDTLFSAGAEMRKILSDECRQTVLCHYSLDRMVSDHLAFYNSLRPFARKQYNDEVILGYHGFDNLGDDALLGEMLRELRKSDPEKNLTVLSNAPSKTAARYGVTAVSRRSLIKAPLTVLMAKTLYVGGGTLLQSETSHRSLLYYTALITLAKLGGATVVYWANGLGPFSKKEQPIVAHLLKGKSVVILRDKLSYDRACEIIEHLPAPKRPFCRLTADGGFLVAPCELSRLQVEKSLHSSRYFVVSLGGGKGKKKDDAALCEAFLLARQKGFAPVFLLMQPTVDKKKSEALANMLFVKSGRKVPILTPSPSEALGIIQGAAFVITSRFHPLLFAASCGTPALSLSDSEKCKSFAADVFGEEATLSSSVEKEELFYALSALISHLTLDNEMGEQKRPFHPDLRKVEQMKTNAQKTFDCVLEGLDEIKNRQNKKRKVKT